MHRHRPFGPSVLLLSLVLAGGCGTSPAPAHPSDGGTYGGADGGGASCTGVTAVGLDQVWTDVLAASAPGGCARSRCHGGGMAGMKYTDPAQFYTATVGVPSIEAPSLDLVAPGDPTHSYLYQKLLPTAVSRMPYGGPYLNQGEISEVEGWICDGAPPPSGGTDGGTPTDGGTDGGMSDGGSGDGGTAGPTVTRLSPATVTAGAGAFVLSITGQGFATDAKVSVGSVAVPTTYVDATSLTAQVDASLDATGAILPVTVTDPTPSPVTSAPVDLTVDNPSPAISAISPAQVATGGAAFTLTVTGTGFDPASVVQVDGAPVPTTLAGAATLDAMVPTLTTAGSHPVTVVNPAPGGGTSAPVDLTASTVSGPTITGLSPSSAAASTAFTLTVTGSGYVCSGQASVVGFGASTLTPTSCSTTSLTVPVPSSPGGSYSVTVTNPGTGLTSNAVAFDVVAPNPSPSITSLSPSTVAAGSGAFVLTVTGTGFVPATTVDVDGQARTTQYVSATSVTADLGSADDASAGTHTITAVNPSPGGGTSGGLTLTVVQPNPAPAITSLSPCGGVAGGGAFTLKIAGSGFIGGSQVTFGGALVSSTRVTATELDASIPGSLVAVAPSGDAMPVIVSNPSPGGGTSNTEVYGLASQAVTLTSLQTTVFSASCATTRSCHLTGGVAPMSLQSGQSYGNLVGVPSTECANRLRVRACDPTPTSSYLAAKILGVDLCFGTQMPKGAALSSAKVQMLLDWIAEGAPNN